MLPGEGHPSILDAARGPFARKVIAAARAQGLRFDSTWEDVSGFVKLVNDGWVQDTGSGTGWILPKVFEGVPRLHLPRTFTNFAVATYFLEARGISLRTLGREPQTAQGDWAGDLDFPGDALRLQEAEEAPLALQEALWVYTPGAVSPGLERLLIEHLGLGPFAPEAGLGVLYAFGRSAGDIQGFSMPFLEREGRLLCLWMEEPLPPPDVAERFFREPLNPVRIARHLERFRELYDMPAPLDHAWAKAARALLRRVLGPGAAVVP